MSLHIEITDEAREQLEKEKRNNYIAAITTSVLSVILGGAVLYAIAIVVAKPEEPKIVGYTVSEENAPPGDPPPPEVTREQQAASSAQANTAVKVLVANAPAAVSLPVLDIDMPDEPAMLEDGTLDGFGDFGSGLGDGTS
ncbi:MAG: hypothetical protein Q4C05_09185, partial [Akkermansia sp.]|nr:hypothetical protein [Akkermansia sp.]